MFLFIMLEDNSQISIPGGKVCSIQFILFTELISMQSGVEQVVPLIYNKKYAITKQCVYVE